MRKTKMICTIGPASQSEEMVREINKISYEMKKRFERR